MAYGYKREKGGVRGYINEKTGERLSRRQYDKMVSAMGAHKAMPAPRKAKQAGPQQRQFNSLLETYVRSERAKGRKINKIEARKSDEFKRAIKMIRTKRKIGESKAQREARQQAVQMGFDMLGGYKSFQEAYDDAQAAQLEIHENE